MIGVWLWLPSLGPIRVSTVVTAVAMFAIAVALRRDPLRALVAVFAWTAVFETTYHLVGIVGFHWPLANMAWQTGAVAGWVILAAVLGVWPDWRLSVLFVLVMAAWVATGFHFNVPGQSTPIDVRDEILNEAAKTTLALAYLVGALRARDERLAKELDERKRGPAIGR